MKQKKHLALLLGCSLILTTCITPAPKASAAKIKLNKKKLNLVVKESATLKLKNCKKKAKWSSSNKKVAKVTAKGKIKAIVKAKKAGTATITAKVGKKKYTCKVTVKQTGGAKASKAPVNTKTPTPKPAATTQAPPSGNTLAPSAIPSQTPDSDTEALAKNVTIEKAFYPNHILLSVTNHNLSWIDSLTISYEYSNLDNEVFARDYDELYYLKPNGTQYIAIPTATSETADNLDNEATVEEVEVSRLLPQEGYTDQSDKLEISSEVDHDAASLDLTIKNHSPLEVKGNYLVKFYDAANNVLDVVTGIIEELDGKDQLEESIDIPAGYARHEITGFSASYEEIDETTRLEKSVTTKIKERLKDCLVVEVTNGSDRCLESVDLDYNFYDAADEELGSESGSLSYMTPTETQTLIIPVDLEPDEIQAINEDYSFVNISLTTAESDTKYQSTNQVKASVAVDRDDEDEEEVTDPSYIITFTNGAALPAEVSYIIYFRDSKGNKVSAIQDTLSLSANDNDFITLNLPEIYDQNDNVITLSSLKASDIEIFAHTYTE